MVEMILIAWLDVTICCTLYRIGFNANCLASIAMA